MDVAASGVDRHLDIFGLHVVDSSSFVSVLFREVFSHPYISFFHSEIEAKLTNRREHF